MSKTIYVNKKEREAVHNGWEYVHNLLEQCSADPDTKEGKDTLELLYSTLEGLNSIIEKL